MYRTIKGVSFTAAIPIPEGDLNVSPGGGFGGYT
jgi:hypothetical protein